jgi:hypothetical protein
MPRLRARSTVVSSAIAPAGGLLPFDSVGAGAQNDGVSTILPGGFVEKNRAAQDGLDVSAPTSVTSNRAGKLVPGNQAKALVCFV